MFWIFIWLQKKLMNKILFKNKELKKEIFVIKPFLFFSPLRKFKKMVTVNDTNLEYKYNKWAIISAFINTFFFAIFDLILIFIIFSLFLPLIFNDFTNLFTWSYDLIFLSLWVLFLIRLNSDLIKMNLPSLLISSWKNKIFIFDLLTLNFSGIICFITYQNSNKTEFNNYFRKNFEIDNTSFLEYKKIIKKAVLLYFAIILLFLFLGLFILGLNSFLKIESLKLLFIFFMTLSLYIAGIIIGTFLIGIIIQNIILNKIKKNKELTLTQSIFLIKYLKTTIDFRISALFIIKFNLHDYFLKNNLYSEI